MATGKPPWSEYSNALTTMFYIANTNQPPPLPESFSPELKDFLQNCLKIIPSERTNCLKLMEHVFITGNQPIFKEVDSISPSLPIHQKINEKEQDFFEIKLQEVNPMKNSKQSDGNSMEHQSDSKDVKEDNVVCELFERKNAENKNLFNTILIKLNSKNRTDTIQNNNPMDEPYKEKNLDTSIDKKIKNNQQNNKIFHKKKSYEFFMPSRKCEVETKITNYEPLTKRNSFEFFNAPWKNDRKEDNLMRSDHYIHRINTNEFSGGHNSIRQDSEKEVEFKLHTAKENFDLRF